MAEQTKNLIYGVEDKPPLLTSLFLVIQHIVLMSSMLVLPTVLISEIGGTFEQVRSVVGLTMIASGIGTILQAIRCRFLGSGFLCPTLCGTNFFLASLDATWLGGLPLMRGMTIIAGLIEVVFARLINVIKFLFPTEITGLVILMLAQRLIPLGISKFAGVSYEGEPLQLSNLMVGSVTLLVMVGVNVWSKGKMRLYSVLFGLICGCTLSYFMGLFVPIRFHNIINSPWVAVPMLDHMWQLSFQWSLLPAFIVVSITGALKSLGNLTMCEQINDDKWQHSDMKRISGGLMADALSVTISGLLGGIAANTSASNIALTRSTGATSRVIGYAAGALFIVLGFFPKIAGLLTAIPSPVIGAILIVMISFVVIAGIQTMVSAGMDTRKTLVIGIAFVIGISLDVLPSLFTTIPHYLRPLVHSSLTLSTLLAVVLNQILKIGDKRETLAQ